MHFNYVFLLLFEFFKMKFDKKNLKLLIKWWEFYGVEFDNWLLIELLDST
jgi:hypothetical protein